MTEYLEILAAEVEAGKPAKGSTGAKFKNNLLACFEGDETNAATPRLEPLAHRRPIAGAVAIAKQIGSPTVLVPSERAVFRCIVVVPGVYVVAGTATSNTRAKVYLGEVEQSTVDAGAFSTTVTATAGAEITIRIRKIGTASINPDASITDGRILADHVPPMAQCQFADGEIQ